MNWEKFKILKEPNLTIEVLKTDGNITYGCSYQNPKALISYLYDGYNLSSIKILAELTTTLECQRLIDFLEVHKSCLESMGIPNKDLK